MSLRTCILVSMETTETKFTLTDLTSEDMALLHKALGELGSNLKKSARDFRSGSRDAGGSEAHDKLAERDEAKAKAASDLFTKLFTNATAT